MARQSGFSVRERERRAERRRIEVVKQQRFRRGSGKQTPAAVRLLEAGHVPTERTERGTSVRETERCGIREAARQRKGDPADFRERH